MTEIVDLGATDQPWAFPIDAWREQQGRVARREVQRAREWEWGKQMWRLDGWVMTRPLGNPQFTVKHSWLAAWEGRARFNLMNRPTVPIESGS